MLPLLQRLSSAVDSVQEKEHGCVPVGRYLQTQAAGGVWLVGMVSRLTPNLEGTS